MTSSADGRNTSEITFFIQKHCDRLHARFPEEELKEWSAFDIEALSSDISVDMDPRVTLAKKYEAIHQPHSVQALKSEYAEINYTVKEINKGQSAHSLICWLQHL